MTLYNLSQLQELKGLHSISGSECNFSLLEFKKYLTKHEILPPRTGHIGDWKSFLESSGTSLDFNPLIIKNGFGYPLLVGTTRGENLESQSGDLVYRPGHIFEEQKPKKLNLKNCRDSQWVPFEGHFHSAVTLVKENGKHFSLVDFHRLRAPKIKLEADFLLKYEAEILELTIEIVKNAQSELNPRRVLSNVFSHWLYSDGKIEAIDNYQNITLDDIYKSFVPLRTQTDTCYLIDEFPKISGPFLVFSGLFIFFLEALFQADRGSISAEFPVHFHWGARRMAGIPPFQKGYFFSDSTQRRFRTLYKEVKKVRNDFNDLIVVLLPAPIFLLLELKKDNFNKECFYRRFTENSFYDSASKDQGGWILNTEFFETPIFQLTEKVGVLFSELKGAS